MWTRFRFLIFFHAFPSFSFSFGFWFSHLFTSLFICALHFVRQRSADINVTHFLCVFIRSFREQTVNATQRGRETNYCLNFSRGSHDNVERDRNMKAVRDARHV